MVFEAPHGRGAQRGMPCECVVNIDNMRSSYEHYGTVDKQLCDGGLARQPMENYHLLLQVDLAE